MKSLSVIMPALNEAWNIQKAVDDVLKGFYDFSIDGELVLEYGDASLADTVCPDANTRDFDTLCRFKRGVRWQAIFLLALATATTWMTGVSARTR